MTLSIPLVAVPSGAQSTLTIVDPVVGTGGGVDPFWTVFTATAPSGEGSAFTGTGTRKIYVARNGSDSNPGTQASPKLTVAAGIAQLRDGFPDWLLFRKGDVWTERFGWIKRHGKSPTSPMLIGAYGTGARPIFKVESDVSGLEFYGGAQDGNNVAIVGIELYSYRRNPADSGWNKATAEASQNSGLVHYNPATWFLVEDCKFSFFVDNLNIQGSNHCIFRRNVIVDSWGLEPKHSQGGYWDNCLQLELIENFFDHNGWLAGGAQGRNVYNHNWYIQNNQRGPVNLQSNVTARDNAGGQCRVGGVLNGNIAISGSEMTNVFQKYTSMVTNNVMTELTYELGLGVAIRIIADPNNAPATYTGNITVHGSSNPMQSTFLFQSSPQNITVTNNIFYDWKAPPPSGWASTPGSGSTVSNNDIDLNGTNNNPSGMAPREPFPHPERTVASYAASIGITPATTIGYLTACRSQSKDNWNPNLAPKVIVNYFRAGFGLASI